mgnify:FL=1
MSIASTIEKTWRDSLDNAVGESLWSVVVFAPRADVAAVVRDEAVYSAGALIHGFIAEIVERAVAGGALAWTDMVNIAPAHAAGTSGVLSAGMVPVRLPLHTAVNIMLTTSDDAAAAALVDLLGGVATVNDTLARAGYDRSRIRMLAGVGDPRADEWQPDPHLPSHQAAAVTCARDVFGNLRAIAASPVLGPMLAAHTHRAGLARNARPTERMRHLTAAVAGARHDVAVTDLSDQPGDVCYTLVLTDGLDRADSLDDATWQAMADSHAHTQLDLAGAAAPEG